MIKYIFNLFGYELTKKRESLTLNTHLKQLIDKYEIDLVIDVGANTGQFGKFLRKIGYEGDILSFEPVSSTFERLRENSASDRRWKITKLALGNKKGTETINVFDSTDFSSLLAPNEFGKQTFKQIRTSQTETIDIDTLDNILASDRQLASRKIFLKMDTQGYDLNVFIGARNSVNSIVAILSEISFLPIYDGMPDYHQVLKEFEASGFVVTGLFPVTRNEDLSMIEMDGVLVNKQYV